jgi:hypothetical protein
VRHRDPSLTANVYTDPKLLDVARELKALPSLSADTAGATANGDRSAGAR